MASVMETAIDKLGRVVIPKRIRDELGLEPGDVLRIETTAGGGIRLEPAREADLFAVVGGVLVYRGKAAGDLMNAVRRDRDQRARKVIPRTR
jgi:AbrB family looped-hinge helix DNA binding protein